jgi:hypothetical protein
MMVGDLNGLIAFLVFGSMGAFSLLLLVAAVIVKLTGGSQHWFIKLITLFALFFITGLIGGALSIYFDGKDGAVYLDTLCWIFLAIDLLISLYIFLIKQPVQEKQ